MPIPRSTLGDAQNAQRERQVPSQINRLRHTVETLQKQVAVLHDRLDGVTRPSAPTTEQLKGIPREQLVRVADEIETEAIKLESLSAGLENLLERLEL